MGGKTEIQDRWINRLSGLLTDGVQSCISAVYPEKCLLCKRFIPGHFQGKSDFTEAVSLDNKPVSEIEDPAEDLIDDLVDDLAHSFKCQVCESCLDKISGIKSPWCPLCGLPYDTDNEIDHLCGSCLKHNYLFNRARSVIVYNEYVRDLVYRFKYNGKLQRGAIFGILLFKTFIRCWVQDVSSGLPDLILPVPLHIKKMRKRGFNQSSYMLRKWCKYLDQAGLISQCDTKQKILVRNRWTESQTGLGKKERFENIKGAFQVKNSDAVQGKYVLLVDDVLTTGATLNECVRVLIKDNAKQVDVLTLARRV